MWVCRCGSMSFFLVIGCKYWKEVKFYTLVLYYFETCETTIISDCCITTLISKVLSHSSHNLTISSSFLNKLLFTTNKLFQYEKIKCVNTLMTFYLSCIPWYCFTLRLMKTKTIGCCLTTSISKVLAHSPHNVTLTSSFLNKLLFIINKVFPV